MKSPTYTRTTRRHFIKGAGGLALGAGFAGLGWPAFAQSKSLTVSWWGEGDVNRRVEAAMAEYTAVSGVEIIGQTSSASGYFERLATQVAGGNAPDVFQLLMPDLVQYAARGAVADISAYFGSVIDTSDWAEPALAATYFRGGQYFVPLGLSTQPAVIVNSRMLSDIGVDAVNSDWTLAEFKDFLAMAAQELTALAGETRFGTGDMGGSGIVYEAFVRSKGKELFTPEGTLGFDRDDLGEWLELWAELRGNGSAIPPQLTELGGGFDTAPVITGQAPITSAFATKGVQGMQSLTEDTLNFASFPRYSAEHDRVDLVAPIELMVVSATSPEPELGVNLLNTFINSQTTFDQLGIARGVPNSAALRATIRQSGNLSPIQERVYDNVEAALPFARPRNLFPVGSSELIGNQQSALLNRLNQDIGYDRMTVASAVDRFFGEAQRVLR